MSLRYKTILIIGVTLAVMISILFSVSSLILKYSVAAYEEAASTRAMRRAVATLNESYHVLNYKCIDWANWDDSYRFMSDSNEAYISSNLNISTIERLELNFLVFLDNEGEYFYGVGLDEQTGNETAPPDCFRNFKTNFPDIALPETQEEAIAGLLQLSEGLSVVAINPVLTSENTGPPRGFLIMGYLLDTDNLQRLAELSLQRIEIFPIDEPDLADDFRRALDNLDSSPASTYLEKPNNEELISYTFVKDITGIESVILKTTAPRTAYMEALATTSRFAWLIFGVGLIFTAVMVGFIEKVILERLLKLNKTVTAIQLNHDLAIRIDIPGNDEMKQLGTSINQMLESLQKAAAELSDSRGQFQTLIDNQGEGVVIIDIDETFIFANPAAHEILGLAPGSLVGKKIEHFVNSQNLDVIRKNRNICLSGYKSPYEFEILHPSNYYRTIIATATPRYDAEGAIIGTFEVFRDITERKQTEKLQASLAAKSEFLSMVSHELRTPLVPIMGYSELLMSGTFGDVPEDFREPLETISAKAAALKRLIDDLLKLNRAEQNALDVKLTELTVMPFLENIVKTYMEVKQIKPAAFRVEGDDFSVNADEQRLAQVVDNIIGNSIKYSGDSVDIAIRTSILDGKGYISISDNGIGIPAEHIPHIFDKFYQVENVITRKQGGVGIGLAVAKELVESMNGNISMESDFGVGSTVTISLDLYVPGEKSHSDDHIDSIASGISILLPDSAEDIIEAER